MLGFSRAAQLLLALLQRSDDPAPEAEPVLESKLFEVEQIKEIKDRFLVPSLDLLITCIEDLEGNQASLFENLMSLVLQQNITEASKKILIKKKAPDVDEPLLRRVVDLLPKADDDTTLGVYQTLYTLLHEYRLNKNPDKDLGFLEAQSGGCLSSRIREATQRIAKPLNGNNDCKVTELSSEQIESIVLAQLKILMEQKLTALREEKNKNASASTSEEVLKTDEDKSATPTERVANNKEARVESLLKKLKPADASTPSAAAEAVPNMPQDFLLPFIPPSVLLQLLGRSSQPGPAFPIPNVILLSELLNRLGDDGDDDSDDDEENVTSEPLDFPHITVLRFTIMAPRETVNRGTPNPDPSPSNNPSRRNAPN